MLLGRAHRRLVALAPLVVEELDGRIGQRHKGPVLGVLDRPIKRQKSAWWDAGAVAVAAAIGAAAGGIAGIVPSWNWLK